MDEKYTWDFALIYKSIDDLERDFVEVENLTKKIKVVTIFFIVKGCR